MNMKAFVIHKDSYYKEYFVNDGIINKFYEMENDRNADVTAVPDACVDIQFVMEDGRYTPYVCGSFLEGKKSPTGKYQKCFGVKFNPGIIPNCIQGEVKEIINGRNSLEVHTELTKLCEEVSNANSFENKIDVFTNRFSYEQEISENNSMVDYAVNLIRKKKGGINIAALVDEMGYNQKYVDRVFKKAVGISLKKYAVIIRVQEAIRYLQKNVMDEIYTDLGYYDQAHFIKDFKRYTCLTPIQYTSQKLNRVIV